MEIQKLIDIMMFHFQMYDLFPNTNKTKIMISEPPLYNTGWIILGYNHRRRDIDRITYEKELVECEIFRKRIQRRTIGDHRKYQHPEKMNIVMGRIKDLPSKEWNHSILDRK